MNVNSFVTPDQILADVLRLVDDEGYEWNTKGYYISQMQQCLEDLSFATFFQPKEIDLDFPTESLGVPMPEGTFNLNQIYVFNGVKCEINNARMVWPKRNYITHGNGYAARNVGRDNGDPFYRPGHAGHHSRTTDGRVHTAYDGVLFYNIQNGIIMFSPACAAFQKIKLIINGTGCPIGDKPIIPLFFRQVTKDYVCEVAFRDRMAKDPNRWSPMWKVYEKRLNKDESYGPFKGSWYDANKLVKSMDDAEREAMGEYLSGGNF